MGFLRLLGAMAAVAAEFAAWFLVIIVITVIQFRVGRRYTYYRS